MLRLYLCAEAALVMMASAAYASEGASYVGAERCRLCHREVHESWLLTPHATAGARLASVASSPEELKRCEKCHATGGSARLGVQCEACHGPGSEYSQPEIMIDPEKAAMAGLVRLSIGICERCHENDEPGHRGKLVMPERAQWSRYIHEVKSRE